MINNPTDNKDPPPTAEDKKRQIQNARAVVQYCMNVSECRRVQVLRFFGEKFNQSECKKLCDNCASTEQLVERDLTTAARDVIALVQSLGQEDNFALGYCHAVFKGSNTKEIRDRGGDKLPQYAKGKDLPIGIIERLFSALFLYDALKEVSVKNNKGFHNAYCAVRATRFI